MKRPRTRQSTGAAEQLSFIPEPPFCPKFPNPNSAAGLALDALRERRFITQVQWLLLGHGWRLAAAIMELNYLGWEVQSTLLIQPGWPKPIAVYSLTTRARRAALRMRKGGAA